MAQSKSSVATTLNSQSPPTPFLTDVQSDDLIAQLSNLSLSRPFDPLLKLTIKLAHQVEMLEAKLESFSYDQKNILRNHENLKASLSTTQTILQESLTHRPVLRTPEVNTSSTRPTTVTFAPPTVTLPVRPPTQSIVAWLNEVRQMGFDISYETSTVSSGPSHMPLHETTITLPTGEEFTGRSTRLKDAVSAALDSAESSIIEYLSHQKVVKQAYRGLNPRFTYDPNYGNTNGPTACAPYHLIQNRPRPQLQILMMHGLPIQQFVPLLILQTILCYFSSLFSWFYLISQTALVTIIPLLYLRYFQLRLIMSRHYLALYFILQMITILCLLNHYHFHFSLFPPNHCSHIMYQWNSTTCWTFDTKTNRILNATEYASELDSWKCRTLNSTEWGNTNGTEECSEKDIRRNRVTSRMANEKEAKRTLLNEKYASVHTPKSPYPQNLELALRDLDELFSSRYYTSGSTSNNAPVQHVTNTLLYQVIQQWLEGYGLMDGYKLRRLSNLHLTTLPEPSSNPENGTPIRFQLFKAWSHTRPCALAIRFRKFKFSVKKQMFQSLKNYFNSFSLTPHTAGKNFGEGVVQGLIDGVKHTYNRILAFFTDHLKSFSVTCTTILKYISIGCLLGIIGTVSYLAISWLFPITDIQDPTLPIKQVDEATAIPPALSSTWKMSFLYDMASRMSTSLKSKYDSFTSHDWLAEMKAFSSFTLHVKNIATFMTSVVNFGKKVIDWISRQITSDGSAFFTSTRNIDAFRNTVSSLCKFILEYDSNNMDHIKAATFRAKYSEARLLSLQVARWDIDTSEKVALAQAISQGAPTYLMAAEYDSISRKRQKPVFMYFHGETRVGKTAGKEQLIEAVYQALYHKPLPREKVYTRSSGSKHWNGFHNPWVCIFDDFLQSAIPQTRADEVLDIIHGICDEPYRLEMAHLDDKANTFFRPNLLIATTNEKEFPTDMSITKPKAFFSRRDFTVHTSLKDGTIPKDSLGVEDTDAYVFRLTHCIAGDPATATHETVDFKELVKRVVLKIIHYTEAYSFKLTDKDYSSVIPKIDAVQDAHSPVPVATPIIPLIPPDINPVLDAFATLTANIDKKENLIDHETSIDPEKAMLTVGPAKPALTNEKTLTQLNEKEINLLSNSTLIDPGKAMLTLAPAKPALGKEESLLFDKSFHSNVNFNEDDDSEHDADSDWEDRYEQAKSYETEFPPLRRRSSLPAPYHPKLQKQCSFTRLTPEWKKLFKYHIQQCGLPPPADWNLKNLRTDLNAHVTRLSSGISFSICMYLLDHTMFYNSYPNFFAPDPEYDILISKIDKIGSIYGPSTYRTYNVINDTTYYTPTHSDVRKLRPYFINTMLYKDPKYQPTALELIRSSIHEWETILLVITTGSLIALFCLMIKAAWPASNNTFFELQSKSPGTDNAMSRFQERLNMAAIQRRMITPTHRVIKQGGLNPKPKTLEDKIIHNTFQLHVPLQDGDGPDAFAFCLFLDSCTFATPLHVWALVKHTFHIQQILQNSLDNIYECQKADCIVSTFDKRDLVLVTIPTGNWNNMKSLKRHLPHLPLRNSITGAKRIAYRDATGVIDHVPGIELIPEKTIEHPDGNMEGMLRLTKAAGNAGDCGLAVMITNPAVTHKLAGIHNASHLSDGIVAPIYAQDLENHYLKTNTVTKQFLRLWTISKPHVYPGSSLSFTPAHGHWQGFRQVFTSSRPAYIPLRTKLRPTPILTGIHGSEGPLPPLYEINTRPAALCKEAVNLSLRKVKGKKWKHSEHLEDPLMWSGVFHKDIPSDAWKPLTNEEVFFGAPELLNVHSIAMSTSPGLPYVMDNYTKEDLIVKPTPQTTPFIHPNVLYMLEHRERKALKHKIVPVLTPLTLKDEQRPLSRVELKYTRCIQPSPLDAVAFEKKYLGRFVSALERTREYDVQVGINPYSYDWTYLAREIIRVGPETVIAGDFDGWDIRVVTHMFATHFWIHFCKFFFGPDFLLRPLPAIVLYIYSAMLSGSQPYLVVYDLLLLFLGMASGRWSTSWFNSVINSVMTRTCYKVSALRQKVITIHFDFDRWNRLFTFGDDNLNPAHPDIIFFWNGLIKAVLMDELFCMTVTAPNKSTTIVLFYTLLTADFLKRSFKPYNGIYLAPLEQESMKSSCQWVMKGKVDLYAQTIINIRTALIEWSLHGEQLYNLQRTLLNKYIRAMGRSNEQIFDTWAEKMNLYVQNH
jgi:hypothetical protein